MPLYSDAQTDVQGVLERFRRTRDEMEVQVMNWLEEQGSGAAMVAAVRMVNPL